MAEKVQFFLEFITKGMSKIDTAIKRFQQLQKVAKQLDTNAVTLREAMNSLNMRLTKTGRFLAKGHKGFLKTSEAVSLLQPKIKELDKNLQVSFGRFPGYLLSIMFFGMAIQRYIGGAIKDAVNSFLDLTDYATPLGSKIIELQGTFKLFQAELVTALEPILSSLIDHIIDLLNWFNNLNSDTKKLIGKVLIGAAAFGMLAFFVGTVGLGINGLIDGFKVLRVGLRSLPGKFTDLAASINPVNLAIVGLIAVIIALYLAWKTNFMGFRDLTFKWKKNFWAWIINTKYGIKNLVISARESFGVLVAAVKYAFNWIYNLVVDTLSSLIEKFNKFGKKYHLHIPNPFKGMHKDIGTFEDALKSVHEKFKKIRGEAKTAMNTELLKLDMLIQAQKNFAEATGGSLIKTLTHKWTEEEILKWYNWKPNQGESGGVITNQNVTNYNNITFQLPEGVSPEEAKEYYNQLLESLGVNPSAI